MRKVIKVSVVVVVMIASFMVGRMSYRSQVTEYLEQDLLDKHDRVDKLTSCQVELRESKDMNSLERESFNALWSCAHEYSILFDITKYDQKYSIDEVQRIRECL